ncbi:MAG: hypothetical protein IJV80_04035 [Clostridia bacterium]|nr:hypothetical protein [Clostridia bacterium]
MIKQTLEKNTDLQKYLFIRGFLATDASNVPAGDFPFYGTWKHVQKGNVHFYTHPLTGVHFWDKNGKTYFLFGHAYNPFTGEICEEKILERIASATEEKEFYDRLDELTGIFVLGEVGESGVRFFVDPAGMQSACYGEENGCFYLSSHPQLLGDILGYEMQPIVKKLIAYKWYDRVMGPYLPADLTPFEKVKRVVPNIEYEYAFSSKEFTHKRFYPLRDLAECKTDEEYQSVIEQAADILKKNMELVLKKWKNPYVSLTGGIDSNTTFAAANGNYDKVKAFSYCSVEKETIDCAAAKTIAEKFGVDWTLYSIPEENEKFDRFEERKEILMHNNGYVANTKDNEIRKRFYLQEHCPAGVEVKSWVSETIRCYWYKHYGRKKMPKLSAKLYRNLYKIFILNRKLAHEVDGLFKRYIEEFEYEKIPAQYPAADVHFNEVTWGSWGGLNISEMKYCFDITILYNNRKFLDLLFKVPMDKRISDEHHLDMKKVLNKDLYDMNIRVVNMKETAFRAFALNALFTINSILPF